MESFNTLHVAKYIELAGKVFETLVMIHLYLLIYPILVCWAERPYVFFTSILISVFVSIFWIRTFKNLEHAVNWSQHAFEINHRKFQIRVLVWWVAIFQYTLRLYCLPNELPDEIRYYALMPYVMYTNYALFSNGLDRLPMPILSQVYCISICFFLSPLKGQEIWILIYCSVIMLVVGLTAYGQTLKVRQLLEEQTLHMSAIHHEIKTPLQGIIGAADVINDELSSPSLKLPKPIMNTLQEFLEVIRVSSIYLTEIIEQMMRFSKHLNNSITKFEVYPFKFDSFLQELKIIASAYPKNPQVKLEFSISPNLPEYIVAERTSLQQSLINIISNALKFTENGHVTFSVTATSTDIIFVCRDTGCGMSKEFMEKKLFTPFSQENSDLNSKPRGLGLGLALSKVLIEQMNGKLDVKSTQNEGSTVSIFLPISSVGSSYSPPRPEPESNLIHLLASRSKAMSAPQSNSSPPKTSSSSNGHKTDLDYCALVVDDNPLNRQIFVRLLTKNGFECLSACSGMEALNVISQHKNGIHLIILDMFMPEMDGAETKKKMKPIVHDWEFQPIVVGCSADNSQETLV